MRSSCYFIFFTEAYKRPLHTDVAQTNQSRLKERRGDIFTFSQSFAEDGKKKQTQLCKHSGERYVGPIKKSRILEM